MRILLVGDIVGKPGVQFTIKILPDLIEQHGLDMVIANAENSADGSGITPAIYRSLINAGVHCITLGDHIYRRKEIFEVLETCRDILRPANFPAAAPGVGWTTIRVNPQMPPVAVISLMGRVFMRPVNCPWEAIDRVLEQIPPHVRIRIVDFHAEATSDKQLMGRYLDGKVTAVLGTHTHVTTADETILAEGTAFQCDVGMTGPHDSILGRRVDRVLETTRSFRPTRFDVATGDVRLSGTIVTVDPPTGQAIGIERLVVRDSHPDN